MKEQDNARGSFALESMSMRLDLVEKKTVEGAQSMKLILTNIRELASIEEKYAKSCQKIIDVLQHIPHIHGNVVSGLKNWHTLLLDHTTKSITLKRQFAASLVTDLVNPLQDYWNQYRSQSRQLFYEMRSSYDGLVNKKNQLTTAKEKYFKACKAAEASIRQRDSTQEKLNAEIDTKKNVLQVNSLSLSLLETRRDETIAGMNQKLKLLLDDCQNTKQLYITANDDCNKERNRHSQFVQDKLSKLESIEIQREEFFQNQIFFRFASMYHDTLTTLSSYEEDCITQSQDIFQMALDDIPSFADATKSPDATMVLLTEQMTNTVDAITRFSEIFVQMKNASESHAKRLQYLSSSYTWEFHALEGQTIALAWGKISSCVQIFSHIYEEYSIHLSGPLALLWRDLKGAQTLSRKQLTASVHDIHLKRQGIENNERDACIRYNQAKKELEVKQNQIHLVEKEVIEEEKSPDKEKGMSLVSLGWKDPAKIRLVKLKRLLQEYEEIELSTITRQHSFAIVASENFKKIFQNLFENFKIDFITAQSHGIDRLKMILISWKSASNCVYISQREILQDVIAGIESMDPNLDLKTFVAEQAIHITQQDEIKLSAIECFNSELIEKELTPPKVESPSEELVQEIANKTRLTREHQSTFGVVVACIVILVILRYVLKKLNEELAHGDSLVHEYQTSMDYLTKMLKEFD